MSDGSQKATRMRWWIFFLACGTSWMMYLHRYVLALIKPELAKEWGLTKEQLGLLDSLFFGFTTFFQMPLGIGADIWGVRLVLSGLIILWCVGLGLHAWAPTPGFMGFARATMGMGQSAAFAALNRIAPHWFPAPIRTTLQGIVGVLASRLGGLCAYLVFGSLMLGVLQLDWRTAIYVLSGIGVAHSIGFFLLFRNSPSEHPWVNAREVSLIDPGAQNRSPSSAMTVGRMLRELQPRSLNNLILLSLQTLLSTFADSIYSSWIPLFLWEVHSLKYQEMGIYSSLPLLGGAVAGFFGGLLNDALIARTGNRRWSRSCVGFCGKMVAAGLLFIALYFYNNPYVFCGMLFLVKFFGDWSITTSWGVVTDIGGSATASVFAFNNTIAGAGAILAPVVFGFLAQNYGWPVVFVTVGVTYILCAVSWLFIDCTIRVID